jgi:hypothetical protein
VTRSKKRNQFGDPGGGPLLTLLQFAFIVLCTLPEVLRVEVSAAAAAWWACHSGCVCAPADAHCSPGSAAALRAAAQGWRISLKPRAIPFKLHVYQTLLFFAMSYVNNKVFEFRVSQPVHMVFRSSNLVITTLMSTWFGTR